MTSLISVEDLHQHKHDPDWIVMDASWHMPASGIDGYQQWQQARIENARFFDFDRVICAQDTDLPHMLPEPGDFTSELRKLGVNHNSMLVFYDNQGIFSSPRAWWMMRVMGHERCAVLDGGLVAWKQAGLKLVSGYPSDPVKPGDFVAQLSPSWLSNADDVLKAMDQADVSIIDARSQARFMGLAPEPRAGLKCGHIPNSANLPFEQVVENGRMKSPGEIDRFLSQLAHSEQHIIFSCGSGVTASILAFAAHLAGYRRISVYDGAWAQWGGESGFPIVAAQNE